MKVGIIGATGYGGLELIRLLHTHQEITQIDVFSSSEVDVLFSEKYPHVKNIFDQPLKKIELEKLVTYDVIFASTPAGVTSELYPPLIGEKPKLIDLSGDFRLQDRAAYSHWYKKEAAPEAALHQSVYGLSEWNQQAIASAALVANPGCYPTATLLALLPLLKEQLIDPQHIVVDAKSGVSGAGNRPSPTTHFSEANENISLYKLHEHQHIPEIEQAFCLFAHPTPPITFTTHLVPMTRGIMATIYAPLTNQVNERMIIDCLLETYHAAPFVRVFNDRSTMGTKQVYGTNFCDIQAKVDERTNRVTIVSVIDNLVKGAAGQAIQNMNIQFGWDEKWGLSQVPLYI